MAAAVSTTLSATPASAMAATPAGPRRWTSCRTRSITALFCTGPAPNSPRRVPAGPAGRGEMDLHTTVVEGVTDLPAADWDALVEPDDPFLEHAFLSALERSKSVGARAGWQPRFVLVRDGAQLVGAVPL